MDEQQLRWCISQCDRAIDALNEDLRREQNNREELERLAESLGSLGSRLTSSKDSGLEKITKKIGSIFAAIKQTVFEQMRSAVCGTEYSTAVSSVNSAVSAVRSKISDTDDAIHSIQSQIRDKDNERGSYWYQLNNLEREGE